MKGRAKCFGAGTIVNAIATWKGAAFGVGLPVEATVDLGGEGIRVEAQEDSALAKMCVSAVLRSFNHSAGASVAIASQIPASRGLKSSSAVANAVTLATLRALGQHMADLQIIDVGIDASLATGVSITGAFDDACACFFGGVVLTDNKQRNILAMEQFDRDLKVILHIPEARQVRKAELPREAFDAIRPEVDRAFHLALQRDYFAAINRDAYARALGLGNDVAVKARAAGALAAGLTGTGPATAVLCEPGEAEGIAAALRGPGAEVRIVDPNTTSAVEAVP